MTTEVWYRNPWNYIRELIECDKYMIAWDRGLAYKKRIDPIQSASLYFGKNYPWRVLMVGNQGTAEYRDGDTLDKPTAVYPTWEYTEDVEILHELLERPVGEDKEICEDKSLDGDERPVFGQENRIIITNYPSLTTGPGRQFIRILKELQEDHPESIIHLHGSYSFRYSFGLGFRASDIDPRTDAQKGWVFLPNGKKVLWEKAIHDTQWVRLLGFKVSELEDPKIRCKFNILSAAWAGQYYNETFKFKTKFDANQMIDIKTSDKKYKPPQGKSPFTVPKGKGQPGDKQLCDTCSFQLSCKFYRQGAVCTVPHAEPVELARYFGSRDAQMIIDGLGVLLSANTRRLENGVAVELTEGELNPEVSRIFGQVFDQGVKLAKLLDPKLAGGAKVQVNVGSNNATMVASVNPKQLVASVVRELEHHGIPRDEITPQMVQSLLTAMADPDVKTRTVEGAVLSKHDEL